MIQGVHSNLSRSDILSSFKRTNGNVRATARELNVCKDTIYSYIGEDETLETDLYKIRSGKYHERCDDAEGTIDDIMLMKTEYPSVAFNAAKYYLETHGKKRGYGEQNDAGKVSPFQRDLDKEDEEMKRQGEIVILKEELKRLKKKCGEDAC